MVQVVAQSDDVQAELLELLDREIEERTVISLEAQMSALTQKLLIFCQEAAVRQTTLCMACLRPRGAEGQIQLLDFARLEPAEQILKSSFISMAFRCII